MRLWSYNNNNNNINHQLSIIIHTQAIYIHHTDKYCSNNELLIGIRY